MSKAGSDKKTYHVGDEVPAVGDSFKYPEYFDILSVEDGAASFDPRWQGGRYSED